MEAVSTAIEARPSTEKASRQLRVFVLIDALGREIIKEQGWRERDIVSRGNGRLERYPDRPNPDFDLLGLGK